MAILEIVKFPDPRLRVKAERVTSIDAEIRQLIKDMYDTMYKAKGVGLAANQVGVHLQIFVMDVSDNKICVINPEILSREGALTDPEGCLSVGSAYDKVKRFAKVRLRGMDINGKIFELEAEGLKAVCIQHETDHLNGLLFIDHLSRLKQDRIRKKIMKTG